jgi:hypothetical protein
VFKIAFRVKTLYEFTKNRTDDLGFYENEVIVVQPFQDENSDWWYGTNEETEESGYFPKTYVEKIDSGMFARLNDLLNQIKMVSIYSFTSYSLY